MVPSRTLEGITVLLVDDDPEELAVVGTLLRSEGADVTAVAKSRTRCARSTARRRACW